MKQQITCAQMGRIGGRSKSKAKTEAARANGKKGGRPKKDTSLSNGGHKE